MYIFLHGLFSIRENASVYLKNITPKKKLDSVIILRHCQFLKTLLNFKTKTFL